MAAVRHLELILVMLDHPRSFPADRKPLFEFLVDRMCNFEDIIVIRRFSKFG